MNMPSGTETELVGVIEPTATGKLCDCCWEIVPEDEIGTLQMPKRRQFKVCATCVNFMWHGRHPLPETE